MSTTLLLSAGKSTRLGDLAPGGCKALLRVGGRTMLDWWRDLFRDLIVVCRTEHSDHLPDDVARVICNDGGGPAAAVHTAIEACDHGPITVIYADTWAPHVPSGTEWCGVAAARGGRKWDVAEDGMLAYRDVADDDVAVVAVGLYRFPEKWRLQLALEHEMAIGVGEVGLADVVNDLGLPLVPVVGWQDVGDPDALGAWRAA